MRRNDRHTRTRLRNDPQYQRDQYRYGQDVIRRDPAGFLRQLSALDALRRQISSLQDRRRWSPEFIKPVVSTVRSAQRLVHVVDHAIEGRKVAFMNSGLMFAEPFRVAHCAKRKIRKEVMFAFGHGGKGGGKKSHRRNAFSGVRC